MNIIKLIFFKEHLEPEGEDDPLGDGIVEMLRASESDMAEADWDCHHPRSNDSMSLDTVVRNRFSNHYIIIIKTQKLNTGNVQGSICS